MSVLVSPPCCPLYLLALSCLVASGHSVAHKCHDLRRAEQLEDASHLLSLQAVFNVTQQRLSKARAAHLNTSCRHVGTYVQFCPISIADPRENALIDLASCLGMAQSSCQKTLIDRQGIA
jgi:uncharacterized membrane protein affecting hemolysin expression